MRIIFILLFAARLFAQVEVVTDSTRIDSIRQVLANAKTSPERITKRDSIIFYEAQGDTSQTSRLFVDVAKIFGKERYYFYLPDSLVLKYPQILNKTPGERFSFIDSLTRVRLADEGKLDRLLKYIMTDKQTKKDRLLKLRFLGALLEASVNSKCAKVTFYHYEIFESENLLEVANLLSQGKTHKISSQVEKYYIFSTTQSFVQTLNNLRNDYTYYETDIN